MRKIIFIIRITSNIRRNFPSYFSTIFLFLILIYKLDIESFYTDIISEQNRIVEHAVQSRTLATRAKSYDDIYNTLTVPCEKSKMVSFASSIMKNIFVFPSQFRFAVKWICCLAFGSAPSACCLLKSIAIIL